MGSAKVHANGLIAMIPLVEGCGAMSEASPGSWLIDGQNRAAQSRQSKLCGNPHVGQPIRF